MSSTAVRTKLVLSLSFKFISMLQIRFEERPVDGLEYTRRSSLSKIKTTYRPKPRPALSGGIPSARKCLSPFANICLPPHFDRVEGQIDI